MTTLTKSLLKVRELARGAGEFPGSFHPALRAAFWFFLALAAAFLVNPEGWLYPRDNSHLLFITEHLTAYGKPLFYGLPPPSDLGLPLMGVASLAVGNMDGAGAVAFWLFLSVLLCLVSYGLGCLLSGRPAGVAAAAAVFADHSYVSSFFDVEQRFYCLLLLIVAAALALEHLSPRARRLAEGLAIGLSFLARSTLCLLPPLLALLEAAGAKRGDKRAALRRAGLVLVVPFLFLLPWSVYNYAAGRGLMLFDGRADWNVVTGAMGLVSTFEGDYRKLAGLGQDESASLWAAKKIVSDPVPYVSGAVKRAVFIFLKHPLIFSLWLLSVLLLWRRPAFRRVNILGLYLVGLHLAFSTEDRYFIAIIPLLAAAAAAGFVALAAGDGNDRRQGLVFSAAGALPVAVLGLGCMGLLLFRPGAPSESLKTEIFSRAPASGDAWLLREYGRYLLLKGDYTGAYSSLGRAAVLTPADIPGKIDLAAAAFLRNRREGRSGGGADLVTKLPFDSQEWFHFRPGKEYVLKSLYELDSGLTSQALQSAAQARRARGGYIHFKLKTDAVFAGEEKARESDTYVIDVVLPELLVYFPAALRDRLGPAFLMAYTKGAAPGEIAVLWAGVLREINWRSGKQGEPGQHGR